MKQYCVYILTNIINTVFYIGVTSNLPKRIYQHKNKLVDGFTKKYNIDKLIYFEQTEDINSALRRETIELITKNNPEWKDLSDTLLDSESSSE